MVLVRGSRGVIFIDFGWIAYKVSNDFRVQLESGYCLDGLFRATG